MRIHRNEKNIIIITRRIISKIQKKEVDLKTKAMKRKGGKI